MCHGAGGSEWYPGCGQCLWPDVSTPGARELRGPSSARPLGYSGLSLFFGGKPPQKSQCPQLGPVPGPDLVAKPADALLDGALPDMETSGDIAVR